jgi:hypothetical protein
LIIIKKYIYNTNEKERGNLKKTELRDSHLRKLLFMK